MGSGVSSEMRDQAAFHIVQDTYAKGVATGLDDHDLFDLIKAKLIQHEHHDEEHHEEHHDYVHELPKSSRSTRSMNALINKVTETTGDSSAASSATAAAEARPHTPPFATKRVLSSAGDAELSAVGANYDKRRIHTMKVAHSNDPTKFRRASIVQESVIDATVEFSTDVLVEPVTLKMMTEFCSSIPHAVERLMFWVDVQYLRTLPSPQYTDKMLRKIYEKFLSPHAATPICVPTDMTRAIQEEFERPGGIQSAGVYLEAQALCLKDLEKDVFPRFQKHKLFESMKALCESKVETGNGAPMSPREDKYSFHAVLTDDTKLRFLKSYCVENLTLENLLFHMEVEEAKRLPNQSYVHACARKVYETYLKPNAKKYIALPQHIHASVAAKVEANQLDSTTFTDVQYYVLEYVRTELWATFSVYPPYVDHIHEGELTPRHWDNYVPNVTENDVNAVLVQLEKMDPADVLAKALTLPMDQLANVALAHKIHRDTLMLLLHDKIAHRIFKKFLASRLKDHFVAFIDEVDEFINLPGIEFMQHTAKKLYKKYLSENAKLQVDMSNKMRQEIQAKLNTPSIDMFRPAIVKVKTGLLQDSMVRYLKSPIHSEMKQDKENPELVRDLMSAVDKGKVDLPHLESVLSNPTYLSNFRKYLKSQHAAENLIFLEEVEEFRRLPSYQIVVRSAKKIVDKYINTNAAKSPIPIAEHLHDDMVQNIDKAGKTYFSDAVQDVVAILRTTEVHDFLDSPLFMQLIGSWVVLDETYAIRQLIGEVELAYFKHVVPLTKSVRRGRAGSTSTS
ncbi:hypothetical protein H310_08465 [Aphanomyces invadans]|uniref:RGS domain-containing protein n=1 Tax=Aphanomyces invadans TaxID=157072 RepID=A0A024TYB0_9STRA|nr:hypothetical protein H310_08465 [Aphanomyces invadans]ETV98993.1 hypothetical protein H310_08465 [Aphanomyces invadans]|eukprot:XP_008872421.1 hypothetical protein H310_08465 [Aphanomyces invadans]